MREMNEYAFCSISHADDFKMQQSHECSYQTPNMDAADNLRTQFAVMDEHDNIIKRDD